ncbi:hypothetical protein TanjilG_11358 [Lupinus angustifolius]|uniref:C2 NT-type domain-containing protein n=1 Tax=Lupinus angustifolius TaxID=3871 RepID=A0A1J7H9E3_LUPAN|nr:PREDICTED: protein PLASTID MOVEMENT IMPAIRED 1-RELATED 1 [Lupinus angustifolius]XP_019448020.1 PREDICTED: protein PLASTID MOVEMENT IMPAIRED 1-RELATED 1 [Lupinus angustifolius]XP_019448021.1 PREDICTED: protein PLASTID MOVEMENT IMPAIRED 1-RELATED 1 [Lupinus angustifolius]OIW09220.1 hypothetical protein TanjilG_11358 [Lupinus angustifolius]
MMMNSMFECAKQDANNGDDDDVEVIGNSGQLLSDIKEISKALYLHNSPSKPSVSVVNNRSKSAGKSRNPLHKDKKLLSLPLNWKKSLKALTHIGYQKFTCCFNLHVHSIEGLPSNFNGMTLCVHWERKNRIQKICSSSVFCGAAVFDEALIHACSVYGSSIGSSHSARYLSKRFLIYASIVGAPEHDIGKHHVDLTRILPLTLEELRGDKSSGKWTTSLGLAGRAIGATLNVSFSYQVMKDDGLIDFGDDGGSVFSKSINFLYQKLDEGNFHSALPDSKQLQPLESEILLESESYQESSEPESDVTEFSIIEQGVETALEEESLKLDQTKVRTVDVSTVEIINVDEIIKDGDIFVDRNTICHSVDKLCGSCKNDAAMDDNKHKRSSSCVNLPCTKVADIAPETNEFLFQEDYTSIKSNYKAHKMENKSNNITESVEGDFLNMLAIESGSFGSSCDGDPQSPREQLLRLFEKETLASGNSFLYFDANDEEFGTDILSSGDCTVVSDLSLITQAAEEEHARVTQSLIYRRKAEILEDLETGSLMEQWGLNERDFENSPETWSGGFGSPIELPNEEPSGLPSIGEGLGSFVQTTGGGFLRSMNPSIFRNAKNGGNLFIQASDSVVLPTKMGDDILEILLHLASDGVEELCNHMYRLMPLQDITGRSLEHIAKNKSPERQGSWQHDLFDEFPYDYLTNEGMYLDSMGLVAIAPIAINKIETLLIEGLRIQSGMSNEEAPSYIHPQYTKMPNFGGRRANLRGFSTLTDGVAKLQLEDSEEIGNDVDGLMGLSMTLDQWQRLDSGTIEGDQNLEQILKILKVHNSNITELDYEALENAIEAEMYRRKQGLLGNHLAVSFVIQLRDPLRNYEPVGGPMLVLTQVERVLQDQNDFLEEMEKQMENEATLNETSTKSIVNTNVDNETARSRFKINEIHLTGVVTKTGKRQLWGTATQQQSGFRWLLASGLGNTAKHTSSKSTAIARSSPLLNKKLLNEDILWSISYANNNTRTNGKELAAENVHVRNPDIIFPN